MRDVVILTHRANLAYFARMPNWRHSEELVKGFRYYVFADDMIEERDVSEIWHPPPAERFVEYGPQDEHWMRPLGLGRIERIDRGPKFYVMDFPGLLDLSFVWRDRRVLPVMPLQSGEDCG